MRKKAKHPDASILSTFLGLLCYALRGLTGIVLFCIASAFLASVSFAEENRNCQPLDAKPVKIEAWISKRFEKEWKQVRREFAEMGRTRVRLWVYPADNPSRVVAIGRCVPAYIAQHALKKTLDYYGEVNSLVHQGFISSHWIGVGTSLFADSSQQPITKKQLAKLLDASLGTPEFQELYRDLTRQDKKVQAFGLTLPNPKLLKE